MKVENYIGEDFPYLGINPIDQVVVTLNAHDVRWGRKLPTTPTAAQLKDCLFHAVNIDNRWYLLKGQFYVQPK